MKTFRNIIYISFILIIFAFPVISKNPNINYHSTEQNSSNLPINSKIKQSEIYAEPGIEQVDTSLMFFGDLMTGRNVEALSKDDNNYPFVKLQDLLNEKNDIRIANLEGPININHKQVPTGSMSFSLPSYTSSILKQNGFNLMQLANNHMQDRGSNGFIETQTILKDNNIDFFGDYYNRDEYISFEKNINNIPFLFIGINMINTDCEKNTNLCIKNITDEVKNTINQKNNYFKIAFIHWGNEYIKKSNNIQQALAHRLIDSGIDLIIGGHPHVIQEIEKYNNRLIFYSLGNFIFDQYFSKDTQQNYAIRLTINNNLIFDIIPLQSIKSQPQIMDEKTQTTFLKILSESSSKDIQQSILDKKIIIENFNLGEKDKK